jgi:hypothetical protein
MPAAQPLATAPTSITEPVSAVTLSPDHLSRYAPSRQHHLPTSCMIQMLVMTQRIRYHFGEHQALWLLLNGCICCSSGEKGQGRVHQGET